MAEVGMPEIVGAPWFGLLVPAATPTPVIEWLNREAQKAFRAEDVQKKLAGLALATPLGRPEDFASFIEADRQVGAKSLAAGPQDQLTYDAREPDRRATALGC